MNTLLLTATLLIPMNDSPGVADLFSTLDANGDGRITADEVNKSQTPFFKRALRVSDRNEDGALSEDELQIATAEPEPVEVKSARGGGRKRGNMNVAKFDKNKDGKISRDEVPPQLQNRFDRVSEKLGMDAIPVNQLQKQIAAAQKKQKQPDGNAAKKKPEMEMEMKPERKNRMESIVKRLDANEDGRLSKDELKNAPPRVVQMMDRDKNGEVSARELAAARRRMQQMQNQPGKNGPGGNRSRPSFEQFDKNGDGKISGKEIPPRMRQNLQRLDKNGDGSVSQNEFAAMLRRQKRKK